MGTAGSDILSRIYYDFYFRPYLEVTMSNPKYLKIDLRGKTKLNVKRKKK